MRRTAHMYHCCIWLSGFGEVTWSHTMRMSCGARYMQSAPVGVTGGPVWADCVDQGSGVQGEDLQLLLAEGRGGMRTQQRRLVDAHEAVVIADRAWRCPCVVPSIIWNQVV